MESTIKNKIISLKTKRKVAIIGCTGMVGQKLVEALDDHPWFEIYSLHGSRSIESIYKNKIKGFSSNNISDKILKMKILSIDKLDLNSIDVIFSAIPSKAAKKIESRFAKEKPVFSTASYYRYKQDVPIFLPIVNGNHHKIIKTQKKNRNWEGFVCPGPNCTTVGLAVALAPIIQNFGLKSAHMVSLQAISGGGYDGVPAFDILGNVIPHIEKEEDKVKIEVKKILSNLEEKENSEDKDGQFIFKEPKFLIDCKCNRVPVMEGHMESVFFQTKTKTNLLKLIKVLEEYQGDTAQLNLPNAPKYPIYVFNEKYPYRPQPKVEFTDTKSGMITYLGGIEETSFENGFKMTILSHNTELGAGRGAVLSAEYMLAQGLF